MTSSHPRRAALHRALNAYAARRPEWRMRPPLVRVVSDNGRPAPLIPLGDINTMRPKVPGENVTASICGDPEPGRSALDKTRGRT